MRSTSARRKEPNRVKYRGPMGTPQEPLVPRDYRGDGPSITCPECGTLLPRRSGLNVPKHAPGFQRSYTRSTEGTVGPRICRGSTLLVADNPLPSLEADEVRARQLVTRQQIARRFKATLETVDRSFPLPPPVAMCGRSFLYDPRALEAALRAPRGLWRLSTYTRARVAHLLGLPFPKS